MGTAQQHSAAWGVRARDWAEVQEGMLMPVYRAVLQQTDLAPGMHLLDVGCGAGLFCQLAAQRGGVISGIDASAAFLEIARERTPHGNFRVGEMEELPFADRAFDLVTGFNSFQFAAAPANALRQARRVAKPGAPLVIAIWGQPEENEVTRYMAALNALMPPPPPGAPGPFALSRPGVLEATLAAAGLTPKTSATIDCGWRYPDEATALRGLLASGPAVRAILQHGEEQVRTLYAQAIALARQADGSYQMNSRFRYVIAVTPV